MAREGELSQLAVDLVIKLGGAAVTDKSTLETLRKDALEQGAALVKQCHEAGQRVVVVHGAGSFGHHQAKQYKVNEGPASKNDYHGFCVTRNSVITLNKYVVECLTDHNLPAVSCPAFPTWQTSGRKVTQWPREAIRSVLKAGLVPVFHGDCVLDTDQGCCILSGDTIIQTLCNSFSVQRVVFLTDVKGVYDKPPNEDGATLLPTVQVTKDGRIHGPSIQTSTSVHDVTGGMQSKLRCAHSIVALSAGATRVFIAKLGSSEAQRLCLDKDLGIQELGATEVVNVW